MAWLQHLNPQSIALIPPAATEISADSQLPCVKDESEGVEGCGTDASRSFSV